MVSPIKAVEENQKNNLGPGTRVLACADISVTSANRVRTLQHFVFMVQVKITKVNKSLQRSLRKRTPACTKHMTNTSTRGGGEEEEDASRAL